MKNIIFDFGDVFINLDKMASSRELQKLGLKEVSQKMVEINIKYEKGNISTNEFIAFYSKIFPQLSIADMKSAWNAVLLDFPFRRLEFLERISKKYNVYLLSNINDLHINHSRQIIGESFYQRFISCFKKVYFSHEINMRKPDNEIFEFVINDSKLDPKETIFVDDMQENTDSAKAIGMHVWNIKPGVEDVVDLEMKLNISL